MGAAYEFFKTNLEHVTDSLNKVKATQTWTDEAVEDLVFVETKCFLLAYDLIYPQYDLPCAELAQEALKKNLPKRPKLYYELKELERLQDEAVRLPGAPDGPAPKNNKRS